MALFYAPNILETMVLPEEESLHCAKVLRMKDGDALEVFDGQGVVCSARIVHVHAKRTEVELLEVRRSAPLPYSVHVAIAPTKNMDRIEWFVEKCTEIGISEITPLLCEHSERKQVNVERLNKIAIAASKQSKQAYVPRINDMCRVESFFSGCVAEAKYIAHCYDGEKQLLLTHCPKSASVVVVIGPEGDFSPQEVQSAISNGFVPVSLGESRLRTETAGVVACHMVNLAQYM